MEIDKKESSFSEKQINWVFFLYFCIMFTLYGITILQFIIQVLLLIYVFFSKIKNGVLKINKNTINNLKMYMMWFGLLTFIAFLSQKWAYAVLPSSKTLITLFRIFVMGGSIVFYIDSKSSMYSILKSFIYSIFIMGIAALLTTPISDYGHSGKEGFGVTIGIHRNSIGIISASMVFMCYYLYKNEQFLKGKWLSIFFVFLLLCTGSRSSVFELVFLFVVYTLFTNTFSKRIKKILSMIVIGICASFLVISTPFLKETYFDRFYDVIEVFEGNSKADASTNSRRLFKTLAWQMFENKPILGYGVDGFITYLDKHRIINGIYFGNIAYSHCN